MDPADTTPEEENPAEDAQPGDQTEDQGPDDDTPIEALNLLPLLLEKKKEWCQKVASDVVAYAKDDEESRADFMNRYANQQKLFAGLVKDLGYPAQGSKAPHIAIMCKALLHLWARVWDQVVPAKGDIVHAKGLGPRDLDRAMRVEKHMNWQLRHQMPDWGTSQMFSILAWLIAGSTFRYYRWDPITHSHAIDQLPIDDVIISYTESDVHPQMKNVERITVVRHMMRWELEKYAELKFYSNLAAIYPDLAEDGDENGSTTAAESTPPTDEDDSIVRTTADKIQGVNPPEKKSKLGSRDIYEQHTMLKFPKGLGVPGLDGATLPVIISVDKVKKVLLAITLRQEPDPIDQTRFKQENAVYEMALKNAAAAAAAAPMPMDDGTGDIGDDNDPGNDQGGPSPAAPLGPPPSALPFTPKPPPQPAPVRMNTIYRIIHFGLFPNTEGFYRMGVGYLLEGSNDLANVLAAEFMLGAKFQNMKTGLMARGTKHKGGDIQLAMGKIMETELEPEQVDKAIKMLEFGPPSDGIIKMVEILEANSEIGPSADIMSGEGGPSNETAKGMSIRNSNAQTLVSVISRIWLDALKYELKLVAHGNSIYLDAEEYFPFTQDMPGQPGQQSVSMEKIYRADYVEDVHLEFTADARMTSKPERVGDAKDFVQLILNSPLVQNAMLVDFAFRKLFTVAEAPEYVSAMGPPPQPPPPPTPEAQTTENAGFFNEKDHPVMPDDDHMAHLHEIAKLKESPVHQHLSSTGKQLLDRHERAHVAQVYLQQSAMQEQIQKAQTETSVDAMARRHGIGGVPGGPPGGAPPGMPGGGPPPGPQTPPGGQSVGLPG